jgi:beta-galactosidase
VPERADVALLLDWPNWWALELDAHPGDVTLLTTAFAHHKPFHDAAVATDVVPVTGDFTPYKLLVVPNLYAVSESTAQRLKDYVRAGGTLVMSYFSGITDEHDRVHLGGYPAPFRDLLGLTVEEFDPRPNGTWAEEIRLQGAEAVETFDSGTPSVTRHPYGDGVAWYLATRPDPPAFRRLMDRVREESGVLPVLPDLPPGSYARTRVTADGTRIHVLLKRGGGRRDGTPRVATGTGRPRHRRHPPKGAWATGASPTSTSPPSPGGERGARPSPAGQAQKIGSCCRISSIAASIVIDGRMCTRFH